ncbi:hypothetical protein ACFL5P_03215 [candidate division KSB1 bacterium]
MYSKKAWLWMLMLGSLWGVFEITGGELMFDLDIPFTSVWLGLFSLFILAVGRGGIDKMGTSTIIGSIAVIFRLVNTSPNYCHLLAIFALGLMFDCFATYFAKTGKKVNIRYGLIGFVSAYGARAVFALFTTYVFKNERWAELGLPRVIDHVFNGGTLTAVIAAFIVPLGYNMGRNGGIKLDNYPRLAYISPAFLTALIWGWVIII